MKGCGEWPEDYESAKGPKSVKAVPRLAFDVTALERLLDLSPFSVESEGIGLEGCCVGLGMHQNPLSEPPFKSRGTSIIIMDNGVRKWWSRARPTGRSWRTWLGLFVR